MKIKQLKKLKTQLFIVSAFLIGLLVANIGFYAYAHGGDTGLIHACVRNTVFNLPNIRIIGANDNCNNNETALDWPKEPGNNGLPFMCDSCRFNEYGNLGNRMKNKNLTNSYLPGAIFYSSDLSGSIFINSVLDSSSIENSNLQNTNFSGVNFNSVSFNSSNLQDANFTNANFFNSSFLGVTGMNTATLTGTVWTNTTCPDGTNSDSNSNTCVGHLTP